MARLRRSQLLLVGALLTLACGNSGSGPKDAGTGGAGATSSGADSSGGSAGKPGGAAGKSGGGTNATAGDANGGSSGEGTTAGVAGGGSGEYAPEFSMGYCVPKGPPLAQIPGVELIAEGDGFSTDVTAVTVDADQTLYWAIYQEGIYRRAKGAAKGELLVDTTTMVHEMFVTATHVYFVQGNSEMLRRAPLASAPAVAEDVLDNVRALGLTSDDQNLYFIRNGPLATYKLALADAVPEPAPVPIALVSDARGVGLSTNSTDLYYTSSQALYSVPIAGGPVTVKFSHGSVFETLVTEDTIYATGDEDLFSHDIDGPTNGSGHTPLARGNLRSETSPYRLDVLEMKLVGDRIYYREAGGALAWVKTDGTDCRVVAFVPDTREPDSPTWAMDDAYFYVIQQGQQLQGIPR